MNTRQTLENSFLCIGFPAGKTSKQAGNHLRFMLNLNHAQWEIITHNADPDVAFTLLTTNLLPTMSIVCTFLPSLIIPVFGLLFPFAEWIGCFMDSFSGVEFC